MKFKIIISSYIFCFLFGAESPANLHNDNGFNYTGKNNGNALVKFTNPEYAFDEISDKNGKAYKKPNFIQYHWYIDDIGSLMCRLSFFRIQRKLV